MRRSTALTAEMIKLSNRRNLMLLGAGALGLGGLAGAAGAAYADDPEPFQRLFGIEPYRNTPAAAAARAEREAIFEAQRIAQATRTGTQMSKVMGNLLNDASFGMLNRTSPSMVLTEDEVKAALAPDQVIDFTGEESAAAMAPNLTDRMFGSQRLGRYQAARKLRDNLSPSIKTS